jgi:hypothetical protein
MKQIRRFITIPPVRGGVSLIIYCYTFVYVYGSW